MNRLLKLFFFVFLSGMLFSGCYPGGADFTDDYDVVYTNYDVNTDFQSRSTYALPDKIVVDVEIDKFGDTTYVYMKDIYAQPMLSAMESNMSTLGWVKVDISANPDMLLTAAGVTSTTYYYDYWYCWWYGGYYPGWGWGYPPSYTVSSITTGTLIMVLVDPNADNPINQSESAWVGVLNGILTSPYNTDRAIDGIDQAFAQSPYLKTN